MNELNMGDVKFIAARTFKVQQADGTNRVVQLGEEVPEARNWPRLDRWIKKGYVTVFGLKGPLSAIVGDNKKPPECRRVPGDKDYGKRWTEIIAAKSEKPRAAKKKRKRKKKAAGKKTKTSKPASAGAPTE